MVWKFKEFSKTGLVVFIVEVLGTKDNGVGFVPGNGKNFLCELRIHMYTTIQLPDQLMC